LFGFLSGLAGGLIILGAAVGILSLFAPAIAGGSAALIVLSIALVSLGAALGIALAMLDGDKLRSIGDMFKGLGDFMVSFKVEAFTNTKEFLDTLSGLDTSIKPVLGDLALIATGQTAQNVTTNATNYSFQQFSANFKNIFKPEITVKIGEKELNAMIDERIDQKAKEN
jgi:predicted NBD/HSP70 family sugar kinase